MHLENMLSDYTDALLSGDRTTARDIVRRAIGTGTKAEAIYQGLLVPAMERIQTLYREDSITSLTEHLASRINRFLTDQIQAQLIPAQPNGKKAVVTCGEIQAEELGGQVCADILEANGWSSFFVGGGVPEDELIELIGQHRPHLWVIYGSSPSGVPKIREMIERIRDIGASPTMNVVVTGGIFDRVEGLWEEVQADGYAPDPISVAKVADAVPERVHLPRDPHAPKRRRRLAAESVAVS